MRVSLIIPTYNRAHLIEDTLESVLHQTYTNWECIVVDDGSNDNTEAIVNKYIKKDKRFSFFNRPNKLLKGANACRNFGFQKSSGDIINWLDSDDLLAENHFEIHVENHLKYNVGCIVSRAETFHENPKESSGFWANIKPEQEASRDMICSKISWATPSVTWKKKVLSIQPFNENLQTAQEWYFHTTMLINNTSFNTLDVVTIKVRRHEERIGKSVSDAKFISRFNSRYLVYQSLKKTNKLDVTLEFYLFRVMLNALKKSVFNKYVKNTFKMSLILLKLGFKSIYWKQLYKSIFLGVPLFLILGKGERFFSFKNIKHV